MSENYIGMTEDELIGQLGSFRPDTPISEQLKQIIQIKLARRQAESSGALVKATGDLVSATGRLARATWTLGVMTALLVLAAAFQGYVMFRWHP